MQVSELIQLTNILATDKNDLTTKEKNIYLTCLNLANNELYEIASSGLSSITMHTAIAIDNSLKDFPNYYGFKLPANLFKINFIGLEQVILKKGEIINSQNISNEYLVLQNAIYCKKNLQYPSKEFGNEGVKQYINISYVPNPKKLVEVVVTDTTETLQPVFPEPYHMFLVHGALYYFYFANKIFMEKMAYIRNIWEQDKKILANFKNYGL